MGFPEKKANLSHMPVPADAAALSGLWETSARCGGPAAETRAGGGRHQHPGRPSPKRQQQRSEVRQRYGG